MKFSFETSTPSVTVSNTDSGSVELEFDISGPTAHAREVRKQFLLEALRGAVAALEDLCVTEES